MPHPTAALSIRTLCTLCIVRAEGARCQVDERTDGILHVRCRDPLSTHCSRATREIGILIVSSVKERGRTHETLLHTDLPRARHICCSYDARHRNRCRLRGRQSAGIASRPDCRAARHSGHGDVEPIPSGVAGEIASPPAGHGQCRKRTGERSVVRVASHHTGRRVGRVSRGSG